MKQFQKALRQIAMDHSHGSGWLTEQIFRAVRAFFSHHTESAQYEIGNLIHELNDLAATLTSFTLVTAAIRKINAILNGQNFSAAAFLVQLDEIYDSILGKSEYRTQRLMTLGIKNKSVLIHSHSATIIASLSLLPPEVRPKRIYQTDSWPGLEGRLQARELADNGYSVYRIPDPGVNRIFQAVDWVILGADSLGATHFTNKIGSLNLVLLAREFGYPVFVLAHSAKRVPAPIPTLPSLEWQPTDRKAIKSIAPVLECVPNALVTEFILEKSIPISKNNTFA